MFLNLQCSWPWECYDSSKAHMQSKRREGTVQMLIKQLEEAKEKIPKLSITWSVIIKHPITGNEGEGSSEGEKKERSSVLWALKSMPRPLALTQYAGPPLLTR